MGVGACVHLITVLIHVLQGPSDWREKRNGGSGGGG